MVAPMPTPTPFTAQISGLGKSASASIIVEKWLPCSLNAGSVMRLCISLRSLPALNARPAPVSSSTATSGSSAASFNAVAVDSYSSSLNALRTSGRLRVSVRTRLSSAIWRITPAAYALSVAVHPGGGDKHDCATLLRHDPVVFVPVAVCSAGGGEHLAQQQPKLRAVGEPRLRVIGARQLGLPFHGGPLPSAAERHRELRTRPQVGQLHLAVGDESQHGLPGRRV